MDNILKKAKLTGNDYWTAPVPMLALHPDFNPHVLKVVSKLMDMTTEELETIDVSNLGRRPQIGRTTYASKR